MGPRVNSREPCQERAGPGGVGFEGPGVTDGLSVRVCVCVCVCVRERDCKAVCDAVSVRNFASVAW